MLTGWTPGNLERHAGRALVFLWQFPHSMGAAPPLIGWAASTGSLNCEAIARMYREDYQRVSTARINWPPTDPMQRPGNCCLRRSFTFPCSSRSWSSTECDRCARGNSCQHCLRSQSFNSRTHNPQIGSRIQNAKTLQFGMISHFRCANRCNSRRHAATQTQPTGSARSATINTFWSSTGRPLAADAAP
jgi:hypothetical protein